MMSCFEATRSVTDFLERGLRLRRRLAFRLHVATCRGCRAYLKQMRLAILGLRSLLQPAGPGSGVEVLLERFRAGTRRRTGGA